MTDAQGRRARWTAALVVAPSAAAVFGASVSWAAHREPATLAKTTHTASAPTAASGPHVGSTIELETVALERILAQDARSAAELARQLAAAHKQLAQLKLLGQAGAPGASSGGTVTGSQPGSGVGAAVPAPVAIQAPPPAAAPPPPPPVQVVTGASGAGK